MMTPPIGRIVLTGDMLRSQAGERSQLSNVLWMQRKFGPLLTAITGFEPEIRMGGTPPFDHDTTVHRLYETMDLQTGVASWAKTFSASPPMGFVDILRQDYAGSLVVSIELSPILEAALDALDVPWIDIGISPLRFLPDFSISFRASQHFAGRFREDLLLQPETIKSSVERISEHYVRRHRAELDGSVIFFAQTNEDRTLIKDGSFAGAREALHAIESMRDGRRVFLKPHPWQPDNPVIAACVDAFGAEVIDDNTYELLSSPHDIRVITLSSSVGPEARAFDKPTHIACDAVQSIAYAGPTSMTHGRSAELWSGLLSSVMPTRTADSEPWRPNALRQELTPFSLDMAIYD